MLSRIEIQDFALIEHAVLCPDHGLLILSGETGAGKSILIDAIGALSGGKVSKEMIRHGQERASVEAVFQQPHHYLPAELIEDLGLSISPEAPEDNELILSRELLASGKSICRINGRLVSLAVLRELASHLIDIHGQHDQQAIFQVSTHLQLLDHYGSDALNSLLPAYQEKYASYQLCLQKLAELGQDPAERARQLDMLQYQTREIESARIKPGEDDLLAQRRKIVANAEKIKASLSDAYDMLDGDSDQTILNKLGQVISRIELAQRHMPDLEESRTQVEEALFALQGAAGDLRSSLDAVEYDPGELDRLDERLDQLFRLKKKYGGSIAGIQAFYQQSRAKLDQLNDGEAQYDQLIQRKDKLQLQLFEIGGNLSAIRKQIAQDMEQHIARELEDLGMKGVRFSVHFSQNELEKQSLTKTGLDRVEFLFSPNPGEPLKPLARIASGGEASRIMLAIKVILANADAIPVLIFDEIDSGVSGRTAGKVAEKLQRISRNRQVFCITHLAQIAAMADRHILIEKNTAEDRTRTSIRLLEQNDDREIELARLLSGGIGDLAARNLAAQMLAQAALFRQNRAPA